MKTNNEPKHLSRLCTAPELDHREPRPQARAARNKDPAG